MASKGPDPLIDDPFAEPLVRAVGVEAFIKMVDGEIELGDDDPAFATRRLAEGMAVRTRFLDNFFTEAAKAGVRQAVILAAGSTASSRQQLVMYLYWFQTYVLFHLFDPASPENAAKLAAVKLADLADDLGCSLPRAGPGLHGRRPGRDLVILGRRTMPQLDGVLKGVSLALDDATLDRIDEIVPPVTDLYDVNTAWRPPAPRRCAPPRPPADRPAAA